MNDRLDQAETQSKSAVFAMLPDEWADDPLPELREIIKKRREKVIILDDDPTGTQTVHDVAVFTHWSEEALRWIFDDPSPAAFILTNTRSMSAKLTEEVNREIGSRVAAQSQATGRPYTLISRSDSTLRGHFPLETDILQNATGQTADLVLIVPAFMAGGRYTINGVHYVAEGDQLIPAGATPFAKDHSFGYENSDLRRWVEEKTERRVRAGDVALISLHDIRSKGVDHVAARLHDIPSPGYCVADSVTERDLAVLAAACARREGEGQHILYRTAASFAGIRAGILPRPVLGASELNTRREVGGLIVVGSYVPKSTSQLNALLQNTDITPVEVSVKRLLKDDTLEEEIANVTDAMNTHIAAGRDVVVYTSRELITGEDADSSLDIGNRVSTSLVRIVNGLSIEPRYLVAKGGITSSDVATKALGIKQATVKGQVLPGVPVWQPGRESRFSELLYVVFPGNVGDNNALVDLYHKLKGDA